MIVDVDNNHYSTQQIDYITHDNNQFTLLRSIFNQNADFFEDFDLNNIV